MGTASAPATAVAAQAAPSRVTVPASMPVRVSEAAWSAVAATVTGLVADSRARARSTAAAETLVRVTSARFSTGVSGAGPQVRPFST